MDSLLTEEMNFKNEKKWNSFCNEISKVNSLQTLQFSGNFANDDFIVSLKNLSKLKILDLTKSPLVTFKSVEVLIQSLKNLSKFSIEDTKKKKLNFQDIMIIIQNGGTLPGVKLIDDKPLPNQVPTASKLEQKKKPWELKKKVNVTRRRGTESNEEITQETNQKNDEQKENEIIIEEKIEEQSIEENKQEKN
eukprot:TRINITY_DN8415_c0_g1_i1.p1 TRINITY_DN8415_c0_g1~~TRINITY_DN8415_c0_g1_i1.p1  ORF type:complete len:192 (-),score=63.73 TRINITY_DN8415_c0_g1_i1:29-604(-)